MVCNFISNPQLQFSPDLVLVSAGFDAAAGDPLVSCLRPHTLLQLFTNYDCIFSNIKIIERNGINLNLKL